MDQQLNIIEDDLVYTPFPGAQTEFLNDWTHRYVAFAGGWMAGKTWIGARKLLELHVHNAVSPSGELTRAHSMVVAPSYRTLSDFDLPALREAFEEMSLSTKWHGSMQEYHFEMLDFGTRDNPSLIKVRTAESPETITGFEVGAVWGDEVARWPSNPLDPVKDPLLQAKGRLRHPKARFCQFMMTFTHEGDNTQVYGDFEADPKPDHALYRARTLDNPLAKQFHDDMVKQLGPEVAEQYLEGKAQSLRGAGMYTSFDERVNVRDDIKLSYELPLQLSIDFNISPGMHGEVGQHHPSTDVLTCTQEFHASRMDVRQMIGRFGEWVKAQGGWRWPILEVFGDASGASSWAGTGESCWGIVQQELNKLEIPFKPRVPASNPLVADRVNAFNAALKSVDGQVHYYVHPRCKLLIRDLKLMKWKDGEVDKNDRKLSHPSDADGYRVYRLRPLRYRVGTHTAERMG